MCISYTGTVEYPRCTGIATSSASTNPLHAFLSAARNAMKKLGSHVRAFIRLSEDRFNPGWIRVHNICGLQGSDPKKLLQLLNSAINM